MTRHDWLWHRTPHTHAEVWALFPLGHLKRTLKGHNHPCHRGRAWPPSPRVERSWRHATWSLPECWQLLRLETAGRRRQPWSARVLARATRRPTSRNRPSPRGGGAGATRSAELWPRSRPLRQSFAGPWQSGRARLLLAFLVVWQAAAPAPVYRSLARSGDHAGEARLQLPSASTEDMTDASCAPW